MKKRALFILFIMMGIWTSQGQECPLLTAPIDGTVNVAVTSSISWENVPGVPNYIISLGTTPGGNELLDRQSLGTATTYTPPLGLPDNTPIHVTIVLFFFDNIPEIVCPSQSFTTGDVTTPPDCTALISPMSGATNVNIAANISWNYAPTATGYRLQYETAAGTVLFNGDVGNELFFNPIADFPADTEIVVRITPYNENGDRGPCLEERFRTGAIAPLPICTALTNPMNGETDVPLTPLLEWTAVPGAEGYRVSIGLSPFSAEIIDNLSFTDNSTTVIEFEPNRTFYIRIIPFNAAGDAVGCSLQSFSTLLGCASFFDPMTGELISSVPELALPDEIGICENEVPTIFTSPDTADGYRWYKVNNNGTETLISEEIDVPISDRGEYRYEAFNLIGEPGNEIECSATKNFTVVSSVIATINAINASGDANGLTLTVEASGIGDYEYAIDAIDGPYQDSPTFTNVVPGNHILFVRDKKGCGVAQETFIQDLTLDGFPKFFTPNGDGINDFWQFIPPANTTGPLPIGLIQIFDRYGTLVAQIDANTLGWDGTFNGKALPASDYWFQTQNSNSQMLQGHFALKR